MKEIKTSDGSIDLNKFGDIIDMYNFYPIRVKADKNKSNDLYYQLLNNIKSLNELLKLKVGNKV